MSIQCYFLDAANVAAAAASLAAFFSLRLAFCCRFFNLIRSILSTGFLLLFSSVEDLTEGDVDVVHEEDLTEDGDGGVLDDDEGLVSSRSRSDATSCLALLLAVGSSTVCSTLEVLLSATAAVTDANSEQSPSSSDNDEPCFYHRMIKKIRRRCKQIKLILLKVPTFVVPLPSFSPLLADCVTLVTTFPPHAIELEQSSSCFTAVWYWFVGAPMLAAESCECWGFWFWFWMLFGVGGT